ncbi:MAG: hypothetical protein Q9167_000519 [Letrouitia subvulpina]
MKKLFHRRKHSLPSSPEQPTQLSRKPHNGLSDPNLPASLYESTSAGKSPQIGAYPFKGNDSSTALRKQRSGPYGTSHTELPHPDLDHPLPPTPPKQSYGSLPVTSATGNRTPTRYSGQPDRSIQAPDIQPTGNARSEKALGQEFSTLSIGEPNQSYDASARRRDPNNHPNVAANLKSTGDGQYLGNEKVQPRQTQKPGIRMVNEDNSYQLQADALRYADRFPASGKSQDVAGVHNNHMYPAASTISPYETSISRSWKGQVDLGRKTSIPRKEIGSSVRHPTNDQAQAKALSQAQSPIDPTYSSANNGYTTQAGWLETQKTAGQHQPRSGPRKFEYNSEDVVKRAQNNSHDTEVIESIAPAVVHETVYRDVHQVREEVITREIHNHDVYHRILPVIDVEVLPPRHFLPIEGGGLVEISGEEVPGRGNNWVIAETLSKIPSDQSTLTSRRQFSARQFAEAEGKAVRQITPEGCERTEQTWIHPPELETGGRDTGQTWPMEFRSESRPDKAHEHLPSKLAKT